MSFKENSLPLARRRGRMAGRPKKEPEARRSAFVGFFVTPAERQKIEERAAKLNIAVSEFARIVLLSDLKEPAPSARDGAAIRALAVEVSRVGNNINQLAHVANERRELPRKAEFAAVSDDLKTTLEKVWAL
jgi:hypothetical protein